MLGPPDAGPNYPKFLEDFLSRKSQGFDEAWRRSINSPLQSINHLYPEDEIVVNPTSAILNQAMLLVL
nr:uncharacterized protein [Tanacetum cinerariifolium]